MRKYLSRVARKCRIPILMMKFDMEIDRLANCPNKIKEEERFFFIRKIIRLISSYF